MNRVLDFLLQATKHVCFVFVFYSAFADRVFFLQTEQLRRGSDSGKSRGDLHLPADARPIAGGVHQVSPAPHAKPHCSSLIVA